MNSKYFKSFLLIFTVLGINLIPAEALTKPLEVANIQSKRPANWENLIRSRRKRISSIEFKKAFSWNGCQIGGQLAGADGRTLAIILDNMSVADRERKVCFMAIPTTLPENQIMQDIQVLYQGTTENPGKAKTSLRRKYSFVSKSQRKIKLDWIESKFESSIPLFQEQDAISVMPKSCGWGGWLIIGIDARASHQASLIVDTADINAGDVKVDIETTPCS